MKEKKNRTITITKTEDLKYVIIDDINGSTNLSRQKYPVLVYIFIITETRVVFKQDADAKNTSKSTKIHFPPQCLVRTVHSYYICPHARRYVSINRIVCNIICAARICVRLSCDFVIGYVIFMR